MPIHKMQPLFMTLAVPMNVLIVDDDNDRDICFKSFVTSIVIVVILALLVKYQPLIDETLGTNLSTPLRELFKAIDHLDNVFQLYNKLFIGNETSEDKIPELYPQSSECHIKERSDDIFYLVCTIRVPFQKKDDASLTRLDVTYYNLDQETSEYQYQLTITE